MTHAVRFGAAVLVSLTILAVGSQGQEGSESPLELVGEEENVAALPREQPRVGSKPSVWVKKAPIDAAKDMAHESAKRATFATPVAKVPRSSAGAAQGRKRNSATISPAKEAQGVQKHGDKTQELIKGVLKKKPCKNCKKKVHAQAHPDLIKRIMKKTKKQRGKGSDLIRKVMMKQKRKKPCTACKHTKAPTQSTLLQKVMQKPPSAVDKKGRALIRAVMKKKPCKNCKKKVHAQAHPDLIKRIMKKKPCKKEPNLIQKVIKQKPCSKKPCNQASRSTQKKSPKVRHSRNVKEARKELIAHRRSIQRKLKKMKEEMKVLGSSAKKKDKLESLKKRLWSTQTDLKLAEKIRRLESKLRLPLRRNSNLYFSEKRRLRSMKKKLASVTKRVLLP